MTPAQRKEALERELIKSGPHYGVPRRWQEKYLAAVKREKFKDGETA